MNFAISNRRRISESFRAYRARLRGMTRAIDEYLRQGVSATPRPVKGEEQQYVVGPHRTHAPVAGRHCGTLIKIAA